MQTNPSDAESCLTGAYCAFFVSRFDSGWKKKNNNKRRGLTVISKVRWSPRFLISSVMNGSLTPSEPFGSTGVDIEQGITFFDLIWRTLDLISSSWIVSNSPSLHCKTGYFNARRPENQLIELLLNLYGFLEHLFFYYYTLPRFKSPRDFP